MYRLRMNASMLNVLDCLLYVYILVGFREKKQSGQSDEDNEN